jgi:hypothetical protein
MQIAHLCPATTPEDGVDLLEARGRRRPRRRRPRRPSVVDHTMSAVDSTMSSALPRPFTSATRCRLSEICVTGADESTIASPSPTRNRSIGSAPTASSSLPGGVRGAIIGAAASAGAAASEQQRLIV